MFRKRHIATNPIQIQTHRSVSIEFETGILTALTRNGADNINNKQSTLESSAIHANIHKNSVASRTGFLRFETEDVRTFA